MNSHTAKASLIVRRGVAEVFDAFVQPKTITRFWLQSSSGALAEGAVVQWHFMVPGAVETVTIRQFDINRKIAFDWSDGVHVVLVFSTHGAGATVVAVEASGFEPGNVDAIVNATEGFAIVLCDLKALLESGQSANLVRDKAELIADALKRS